MKQTLPHVIQIVEFTHYEKWSNKESNEGEIFVQSKCTFEGLQEILSAQFGDLDLKDHYGKVVQWSSGERRWKRKRKLKVVSSNRLKKKLFGQVNEEVHTLNCQSCRFRPCKSQQNVVKRQDSAVKSRFLLALILPRPLGTSDLAPGFKGYQIGAEYPCPGDFLELS